MNHKDSSKSSVGSTCFQGSQMLKVEFSAGKVIAIVTADNSTFRIADRFISNL